MKSAVVAVIPARGGSKRLPGKNKKLFFGKPMIQYSIEAAKRSNLFERIIVSTDSDEIREIAIKCGAEVPFVRPANLSDDFTPIPEVFAHGIRWLEDNEKIRCESACMILATAPFIQIDDLKKGFELLKKSNAKSVVPVASFGYPIFRSLKVDKSGLINMFWPEHEFTRSNDLPEAFHDAGQFYWVNVAKFNLDRRLLLPDAVALPIQRHLVQDIDTVEDWERAEHLYRAMVSSAEKES